MKTSHGSPGRLLACVGTYTGASGAEGHGPGIEQFEVDLATGELSRCAPPVHVPNPSWIALHPSKRYLYAVHEIDTFDGNSGAASAFAIDRSTGALRKLNTVNSAGAGPAHCSIDAAGKFAFVANYAGASFAVLPILADGSLGSAVDVHPHAQTSASPRARALPSGSGATLAQDAAHPHMIAADPDNRFVLAADLGLDRIFTYRFDRATGHLTPPPGPAFIALPAGEGPRHFAFHPNGHWLYSIQEKASTVALFHYDPSTGSLDARQTASTLPAGFAGTSFAAEIAIAPNGRHLYATNRLHDTIASFSIGEEGCLAQIGEISTMGAYPRHCRIDPGGKLLFVCNQHGDCITSFRMDRHTGLLTFTGRSTEVASPAHIIFLH